MGSGGTKSCLNWPWYHQVIPKSVIGDIRRRTNVKLVKDDPTGYPTLMGLLTLLLDRLVLLILHATL